MSRCQWEGCARRATVAFSVRLHGAARRITSKLCLGHHERAAASISGEATFLEEDAEQATSELARHPAIGGAA